MAIPYIVMIITRTSCASPTHTNVYNLQIHDKQLHAIIQNTDSISPVPMLKSDTCMNNTCCLNNVFFNSCALLFKP